MTKENFENNKESLSYSQGVELVESLFLAAKERNDYVTNLAGDFDTFAESFANLPEYRAAYDKLDDDFMELRKQVDELISNKEEFVLQLEDSGEVGLAEKFARVFGVEKPKQPLSTRLSKLFGGSD